MARVEDFFIMDNAVTGITDEDYRNIQDVMLHNRQLLN